MSCDACPPFHLERKNMSVPVSERSEGKFSLAIKAESLARYTIEIASNENVFLPVYRERLTDEIVMHALEAYMEIRDANDTIVHVGSKDQHHEWMERRRHQEQALTHCRRLLWLIDIAHRVFHLSGKRVKYWGEMTINVRNRIQAWMQNDAERYSEK